MQCVLCTLYNVHKAQLFCTHILYIPKYTVFSMYVYNAMYIYAMIYIIYLYTNIFIHYTGYTIHNICEG